MDVFWLEQAGWSLPARQDWLSEDELATLSKMRFSKRRADWLLGRWTAKRTVSACLNLAPSPESLAAIEICPAPSGAPEVFVSKQPASVTISISHSAGRAVCALARGKVALGCDLEKIEPRSDIFVADYFTQEERAWVARAPKDAESALVTLIWSAKESVLKALGAGLRLDTRSIEVSGFDDIAPLLRPDSSVPVEPVPTASLHRWTSLTAHDSRGQVFHGWWLRGENLVRTLVAKPNPGEPAFLSPESALEPSRAIPLPDRSYRR